MDYKLIASVGVNGNTLAVANNLTKSGTITAVDGWAGGDAAKGDGSTGYYQVTNFTGIPSGANNIEFNFLISVGALGANQCIVDYGSAAEKSAQLHQKAWLLKGQIESANTLEDLDKINWE